MTQFYMMIDNTHILTLQDAPQQCFSNEILEFPPYIPDTALTDYGL